MGLSNEDLQRVRGYLTSQAQKLSVPNLVEKLRADSLPLRDAIAAFPPEYFDARPSADDWSAALVCTHILDMTEHGAQAVVGILDAGAIPAAIADARPGFAREGLRRATDFWPTFTAHRDPFYARVLQATGDEHLDETGWPRVRHRRCIWLRIGGRRRHRRRQQRAQETDDEGLHGASTTSERRVESFKCSVAIRAPPFRAARIGLEF